MYAPHFVYPSTDGHLGKGCDFCVSTVFGEPVHIQGALSTMKIYDQIDLVAVTALLLISMTLKSYLASL